MKIVIVSGGTGSIALQTGLHNLFANKVDDLDIKVLVNAYDNGLSTGLVRKVFDGKILGPSDVRKNQTTLYKLYKADNVDHAVLDFLEDRFTCRPEDAEKYCLKRVYELREKAPGYVERRLDVVINAIKTFFSAPMSKQIDYNDFALCNIVYAGLAANHYNSLRIAAGVMADVLGIKDNVILNDDTSLFLNAITADGTIIHDEGDIVSWNNPANPIVDIQFVDHTGKSKVPELNDEAYNAIIDADLVILSSGTQWSSLIPTYASKRWAQAIEMTKARVLMVMNRVPDKDAPEQSADEIVKLINDNYINVFNPKAASKLEVLIDSSAHELMNSISESTASQICKVHSINIGGHFLNERIHKDNRLASAVMRAYFDKYLGAKSYVFDYDDTLVGRGNTFEKASSVNRHALVSLKSRVNAKPYVCSGNGIKAINLITDAVYADDFTVDTELLTVFADGGINEYTYDYVINANRDEEDRRFTFVKCLDKNAKLSQSNSTIEQLTESLCVAGIPLTKIENRGDVSISIKPIDSEYRVLVHNYIKSIVGAAYEVKSTGRTTIEITRTNATKEIPLKEILKDVRSNEFIVYVGDEMIDGNDTPVAELAKVDPRVICLSVNNPADTAMFLITLTQTSLINDNRI